ncbi:MAG: acetyl-CoA carboxylase biotin carboxylase subunit [Candidatus Fischerbacteria bacterium RBG_13_37_8]|uniref:Acetyl-CoA carboxylase biotin carboxylase subunit n=1 Tax=Candidatus Fischerbacteria bacterium RBG_13_37_8 TaxID=1817863 RepID=A0A1F5VSR6_9BACT|nr:MAG: acetyl-CoA carboxylase biotin carboxylase subunit [Candidatus Fischerbacteria bacterium RBG_13_37_8]
MFKRILIANRGEIAVRIIRACRELGITAIVVYSEADRKSLSVRYADEAYCVGPPSSIESYLRIDKIIAIAKKCNADAIHPGYGFLAENAEFSKACEDNNIIFIGPSADAIESMGEKTRARKIMSDAGVPVVPGSLQAIDTAEETIEIARQIGYPIMIKAAFGGGGKGMRLVNDEKELKEGFRVAASESMSAFGNAALYIEKYIEDPHHIEIQILADHYGNVIHLGERDCSIQRRHQKIIEETPSPFINEQIRNKMGEIAIKAAQAVNYTNAGTIEFLVDGNKNFYFMEMNTRLQVEHPITEMVTGIDIVKKQIYIASGVALAYRQEDILLKGNAIECRIYAEDPDNNFYPCPGTIAGLRLPGGPGVRDDSGVYEGYEVPIYYDPLLSKLVVWGRTREEAFQRMSRALEEYKVEGIKTTIPFYRRVMSDSNYQKGIFNTKYVDLVFSKHDESREHPLLPVAIIAAAISEFEQKEYPKITNNKKNNATNEWKLHGRHQLLSSRLYSY